MQAGAHPGREGRRVRGGCGRRGGRGGAGGRRLQEEHALGVLTGYDYVLVTLIAAQLPSIHYLIHSKHLYIILLSQVVRIGHVWNIRF